MSILRIPKGAKIIYIKEINMNKNKQKEDLGQRLVKGVREIKAGKGKRYIVELPEETQRRKLLDLIGATTGILGAILVGLLHWSGYVLFMVCNGCYGVLGGLQKNWGLVALSIILFIIDIYFFLAWTHLI